MRWWYVGALVLLAVAVRAADDTVWNADFEAGITGWGPYGGAAAETVLSQTSDERHSGDRALAVSTSGEKTLAGVSVSCGVTSGHAYRVDAWLKGSGTVMLCVMRGGIWVYGNPVDLSMEWRLASIRFVGLAASASLSVLTCKTEPQRVTFFLDDVAVVDEAAGYSREVEVEPFLVEAEDFRASGAFGQLVEDASASAGVCVEGRRHFWLTHDVPYVPQTTLPFFIYVRIRSSSEVEGNVSIMRVVSGQKSETLSSTPLPASASWQWIRTGPHSYRMGPRFCVSWRSADALATAALDAELITTRGDLDEEELDRGLSRP